VNDNNEPGTIVIGSDEVGRGSIFGPIVIGAVANPAGWWDKDVRDSKRIKSEKRRQFIAEKIKANLLWNVASAPAELIDAHGLEPAQEACYRVAIDGLLKQMREQYPSRKIQIIMDGHGSWDLLQRYTSDLVEVVAMEKADDKIFECGAASIVAKVARDNWIHDMVRENPTLAVYDLDENKGYVGQGPHTMALLKHGMSPWHRKGSTQNTIDNYKRKIERNRNG
jgi:ribonuclease HII